MGKIPKEQREEIVMHYLEIVGLSDYSDLIYSSTIRRNETKSNSCSSLIVKS